MSPPKAPLTGGGIELPPKLSSLRFQQNDSDHPQHKPSPGVSSAELKIALQAQHAEDVALSAERKVNEFCSDVKDIKNVVIKMESTLDSLTKGKEAKRGYKLAYIAGTATILAAVIVVGVPACQSLKKDLVSQAANAGEGKVEEKAKSTEEIRRAAVDEYTRKTVIQTMDEMDQRNKAAGLVLVPSSMVVSAKPPPR